MHSTNAIVQYFYDKTNILFERKKMLARGKKKKY